MVERAFERPARIGLRRRETAELTLQPEAHARFVGCGSIKQSERQKGSDHAD